MQRHTLWGIGAVALIALLGAGCATNSAVAGGKIVSYYNSAPRHEGVIYGVGTGESVASASDAAALDIARQITTTVSDETVVRLEERRDAEGTTASESIASVSTIRTGETVLERVERLDHTVSSEGTVFALAYVDLGADGELTSARIMNELNRRHNLTKFTRSSLTVALPGVAQLLDREPLKGGVMVATAVLAAGGATVAAVEYQTAYRNYLQAGTSSLQSFYRGRMDESALWIAILGGLYLVDGIVSAVDYLSTSY